MHVLSLAWNLTVIFPIQWSNSRKRPFQEFTVICKHDLLFIYLADEMAFKVSIGWGSWIVPGSIKVNVNSISLLQFKLRCCSNSIMSIILISKSKCFFCPIHIKPQVCIAGTIRPTSRMEKINSINRSCELPIARIISTSNIIFDSIPNNLKLLIISNNITRYNIFHITFVIWYYQNSPCFLTDCWLAVPESLTPVPLKAITGSFLFATSSNLADIDSNWLCIFSCSTAACSDDWALMGV